MPIKLYIKNIIFAFINIAILTAFSLSNGYPFIDESSISLINYTFNNTNSFYYSPAYSWLLKIFSFDGKTLWSIIILQNTLIVYLIYKIFNQTITLKGKSTYYAFIALLIMSLLSSLPYVSNYISSNIFTPILILTSVVLFISRLNIFELCFLLLVYFFSCSTKAIHLPLSLLIILIISISRYFKILKIRLLIRNIPILLILIATLVSVFITAQVITKTKHVHLMASFIENGAIQSYLDQKCKQRIYQICDYKDSLPNKASLFLNDTNSPLYKTGGIETTKKEYNKIIKETYFNRYYLLIHIKKSIKATIKQCTNLKIQSKKIKYLAGTPLLQNDYTETPFLSEEIIKKLLVILNIVYYIVIIFSVFIIFYYMLFGKAKNRKKNVIVVIIISGFLIQVWLGATFIGNSLYSIEHIIWLIPFLAILLTSQREKETPKP